ncbi:MAG TPA: response regulator transcription factor [Acidimicrobiales bacterium]|nr:response regulator transcription factor [Acidimicrobiales bacterium]
MPASTPQERSSRKITVLVADDDVFFRFLVGTVLAGTDDIEVIGEASSGPEAVSLARQLKPQVVLLDVTMPGGGGVQAARDLQRGAPGAGVIMLTGSDDGGNVQACLKAGANAYVLKPNLTGLAGVIRAVGEGLGVVLSPAVAANLVDDHERGPDSPSGPLLSSRELEVLGLIAKERTNDDIARELWLSSHTVKRHVANILAKLDVRTRAEAVDAAVRRGVLPRQEAAG